MSIDPQIQKVLNDVRDCRNLAWNGMLGEELRAWMNFAAVQKAGKFEFDNLFKIFDRQKLNDDYTKARTDAEAKVKDVWLAKIAGDWLAGLQRDHAMRTRSRVRFLAHAAARAKIEGTDEGSLTVNTMTLLARIDTAQEKE